MANNNNIDAVSFIKALHERLVSEKTNQTTTEARDQGTKRSRETEEGGDRDAVGRFATNNKVAKRAKPHSVVDAINTINSIYSESSRMPDALKHRLAQQVCGSYGIDIDSSIFGGDKQENLEEAGAEQNEEGEKEGAGKDEDQAPIGEEVGEEKETASSEPKQPDEASRAPNSFPRFDLSAYSDDQLTNALTSAFSIQQQQAASVTMNSETQ